MATPGCDQNFDFATGVGVVAVLEVIDAVTDEIRLPNHNVSASVAGMARNGASRSASQAAILAQQR
jgi:hypothetical protein